MAVDGGSVVFRARLLVVREFVLEVASSHSISVTALADEVACREVARVVAGMPSVYKENATRKVRRGDGGQY